MLLACGENDKWRVDVCIDPKRIQATLDSRHNKHRATLDSAQHTRGADQPFAGAPPIDGPSGENGTG
jgi:hypothetical protein